VVFECIGVAGALDHSVRLVRPGGLVVSLGDCVVPDPFSVTAATAKQARLMFSLGYDLAEFAEAADALAGDIIDPRQMISEVVSLAATPAKIAELQRGATQTKVQVDPWLA
jgi:(R,R)-butanediol dehydrogenase/meso-butanediol dehydrogenase/diacetyl reductase